jgi:hypothetical protein
MQGQMNMSKEGVYHVLFWIVMVALLNILVFTDWMRISKNRVNIPDQHKCNGTIISLATFGSRTFKVKPTIQSLMNQTFKVDMIVLNTVLTSRTGNISKEDLYKYLTTEFGTCTQSIHARDGIMCDGNLLILFGPDLGPATKVLGTIQALSHLDEDACIISVDDDVIYDKSLAEVLISRAPLDGALGVSCETVPFGLDFVRLFVPSALWWSSINGQSSWWYPFNDVVECNGWLQGFQGIIYRKWFFSGDDVFSMSATMPNGCFYADDVRLSGFLWSKGIKRYVYPHFSNGSLDKNSHLEKNQSDALSLIKDTMQLKQWPCVQHFGWG